jgi:hypothetical protein
LNSDTEFKVILPILALLHSARIRRITVWFRDKLDKLENLIRAKDEKKDKHKSNYLQLL